ncbi:MAG: EamA family transporter RarD [Vallitaleaceae bacterium]|jgi:chloramphenicol-sensitive protein RarD|nr:EamA family transporter RarD [Vallitaleaceae bacterium]
MTNESKGYVQTFLAYFIWGFLPLYWKQLGTLAALEIMSFRIICSFLLLLNIVTIRKEKIYVSYIKDRKKRVALLLTGSLIAINWFVFIFAVNSAFVLQASFGYYINPIISILIGVLLLKEKMNKLQVVSLSIVIITVVFMAISFGQVPWISLILAFSFGFYGYLKKIYKLDSLHSLLLELLIALPFLLIFMSVITINGTGHLLNATPKMYLFMALAGVVTVIPLLLFSEGAKRIPLASVGILQYIAPTLMLLIGVVIYKEPFTMTYKISFVFIWIAVGIYMYSVFRNRKKK